MQEVHATPRAGPVVDEMDVVIAVPRGRDRGHVVSELFGFERAGPEYHQPVPGQHDAVLVILRQGDTHRRRGLGGFSFARQGA